MNLDKIRRRDLQLIAYHEAGHLIALPGLAVMATSASRTRPKPAMFANSACTVVASTSLPSRLPSAHTYWLVWLAW